jgi:hypothetical protein
MHHVFAAFFLDGEPFGEGAVLLYVLAHKVHQLACEACAAAHADGTLGLVQRGEEPLIVVWLQEVVHGVHVEGLQGVAVVRGEEDHEGQRCMSVHALHPPHAMRRSPGPGTRERPPREAMDAR